MSDLAARAERDLNTYQAKQGTGPKSVSTSESGVNVDAERRFPGSEVQYGDESTMGAGDDTAIPQEEGGSTDARGRMSKGRHFEGKGGREHRMVDPEDTSI